MRINGALALSIPDQRSCYGDVEQFCMIWGCLTHALEVIDQIADVSELKYRDTLRDQVGVVIFYSIFFPHMLTFLLCQFEGVFCTIPVQIFHSIVWSDLGEGMSVKAKLCPSWENGFSS